MTALCVISLWFLKCKPLVAPKQKYSAPRCLRAMPAFFKRNDETNFSTARLLSLAFRRHPACWSHTPFLCSPTEHPVWISQCFILLEPDLTRHFITLHTNPKVLQIEVLFHFLDPLLLVSGPLNRKHGWLITTIPLSAIFWSSASCSYNTPTTVRLPCHPISLRHISTMNAAKTPFVVYFKSIH